MSDDKNSANAMTPTNDSGRGVLLPCPFCGGEPISHGIEPHKHTIAFAGIVMPDHKGSHVIECARCECGMIGDSQGEVNAAWNRRADHAALTARVAELELALRGLLGPRDDEKIGWRSHSASHRDLYRCEFCGAEHEDFSETAHSPICPIVVARAALSRTKEPA